MRRKPKAKLYLPLVGSLGCCSRISFIARRTFSLPRGGRESALRVA